MEARSASRKSQDSRIVGGLGASRPDRRVLGTGLRRAAQHAGHVPLNWEQSRFSPEAASWM